MTPMTPIQKKYTAVMSLLMRHLAECCDSFTCEKLRSELRGTT